MERYCMHVLKKDQENCNHTGKKKKTYFIMKEYAYKKTKLLLPKWTIMPIAWDGHFRWNMQVNLVQLIIIIFITCYEWDIYAVDILLGHFKSWNFLHCSCI